MEYHQIIVKLDSDRVIQLLNGDDNLISIKSLTCEIIELALFGIIN